jgi:hypothetical protein
LSELLSSTSPDAVELNYSGRLLNGTIPTEIGLFTNLSTYYRDWCNDVHIWFSLVYSPCGAAYLDLNNNTLTGSIPSFVGRLTNLGMYHRDWCNDVPILILIIIFTWLCSSSRSSCQCIDGKYPFSHWTLNKFGYVLSWLVQGRPYFDSNYIHLVVQLF